LWEYWNKIEVCYYSIWSIEKWQATYRRTLRTTYPCCRFPTLGEFCHGAGRVRTLPVQNIQCFKFFQQSFSHCKFFNKYLANSNTFSYLIDWPIFYLNKTNSWKHYLISSIGFCNCLIRILAEVSNSTTSDLFLKFNFKRWINVNFNNMTKWKLVLKNIKKQQHWN